MLRSTLTFGALLCSVRAADRIVNGDVDSTDNFPFMVSIEEAPEGNYTWFHFCGGSLIRKEKPAIVLTAAHCLEGNSTQELLSREALFAVMGKDDVQGPEFEDDIYDNFLVTAVKIHLDYGRNATGDTPDIALMVLEGAVIDYPTVDLPTATNEDAPGENYTIMGYGADYSDGPATDYFEDAAVHNYPLTECNRWLTWTFVDLFTNTTNLTHSTGNVTSWDWSDDEMWGEMDESDMVQTGSVCAFAKKRKDTCQGDSGGPMIRDSDGKQVGVVSWGFGCADRTPGVYTDVGHYYHWVQAASACLVMEAWMDDDSIAVDRSEALLCDSLCEYETAECTDYASMFPTTTGIDFVTSSSTAEPTEAEDSAVMHTPLLIAAALLSMIFN